MGGFHRKRSRNLQPNNSRWKFKLNLDLLFQFEEKTFQFQLNLRAKKWIDLKYYWSIIFSHLEPIMQVGFESVTQIRCFGVCCSWGSSHVSWVNEKGQQFSIWPLCWDTIKYELKVFRDSYFKLVFKKIAVWILLAGISVWISIWIDFLSIF